MITFSDVKEHPDAEWGDARVRVHPADKTPVQRTPLRERIAAPLQQVISGDAFFQRMK